MLTKTREFTAVNTPLNRKTDTTRTIHPSARRRFTIGAHLTYPMIYQQARLESCVFSVGLLIG
ncbi:hypothetical protein MKW35_16380, partial [Aestuariibaculum sp. L182]|nr:hypothetical protein [Aestuariibaculum lutulentum]